MQYDESFSIEVPQQSAGVVIVDAQNRVLLVQEARGRRAGLWHIPSGKVEQGEVPQQAAIREAEEETGLKVELGSHLGSQLGRLANDDLILRHAWLATVVSGSLTSNPEITAFRYVTPAEFDALYQQRLIRMHHTKVFVDTAFQLLKIS